MARHKGEVQPLGGRQVGGNVARKEDKILGIEDAAGKPEVPDLGYEVVEQKPVTEGFPEG